MDMNGSDMLVIRLLRELHCTDLQIVEDQVRECVAGYAGDEIVVQEPTDESRLAAE